MSTLLFLGFLIGLTHAFEADHLAALSSLSKRGETRGKALRRGAFWGIGHMVTLTLVALPLLWLGLSPTTPVSASLEMIAGLMLLGLGLHVLWRLRRDHVHFHIHQHEDGARHLHLHSHRTSTRPHSEDQHQHRHPDPTAQRAIFVGMIHGMAGSAALFVLATSRLPDPLSAVFYILLFGLGGVVGMAVMSVILALPLQFGARLMTKGYVAVQCVLGLITFGLGAMMAWENGRTLVAALAS